MLTRVGFSENSKVTANAATSKRTVVDIVSSDLNTYLNQGNDRQKRLNFLSRKLEIHKKTLQRISLKENSPSYATIIKFYRFLYNLENDAKVLEMVPDEVQAFLKKSFPEKVTESSEYNTNTIKILAENPVALEIYLVAAAKGISANELKDKFGEYGLKIVNQLVGEKLISESSPGVYVEGQRQFTYSPELVIQSGKICVQSFAKPSSGYQLNKHFAGFYYEKLTPEAYTEWMRIDQQAMKDKLAVVQKKESIGSIPAFTFNIVETFLTEEES